MQIITSLEELRQKAVGYRAVPVAGELFSDVRTPIEVLRILKNVSSHCFLFESVENQEIWGRYTFLGFDPKEEIAFTGGKNPRGRIEEILKEYKSPRMEKLPSFTGGLVGYFSYDYVKCSNSKLKLDAKDEEGFKDVDVMLFDKVIAFDNVKQKIIIMVTVKTDELEKNYENAAQTIKKIAKLIIRGDKRGIYGGAVGYLDFTGNLDTFIGIRLAYKKNGKVFVRSGAGIVADSVPEKEFQECINKAKAVVEAIKKAQQMAAYEGTFP